jgi:CheY-like chemotaxis protein
MKPSCAVLALDCDAEALISLEHALEDAGFSTTTTWHMSEAMELACSGNFEIFLVRSHPQIDVAPISRNLGSCVLVKIDDMRDHPRILDLLRRRVPHDQVSEERVSAGHQTAASSW